ncbi:hypothetical protein QUF58_11480 [Anaerolineales bacterium HSG24]|nr:hypothetical protein [Anaerolineales bacterium HSG24]
MIQDPFINQIANKIADLGLTTPAILLLTAHKPWAFIGSQCLLVAQPTLNIVMPPQTIQNLVNLLAEDSRLEQLIASLESRATESRATQDGLST